LSQGVVLLHDKARFHTAHLSNNTTQKLNWEVLEHPAHSPDLAPSDFHPFGLQFADDDEVKEVVHKRLRNQRKPLFFPVALKSLEMGGLCVSRRKVITLKINVLMSVTQIKIFKKIKCGNFLNYPRIITE
jgi:hypothetical protein